MAETFDDAAFWLPPQFLADDDDEEVEELLLLANREKKEVGFEIPADLWSSGGSSGLGSPVESVTGSTETESDEDDYLAGLTRRLARSTFEDDDLAKARVLPGSPKSTLCPLGLNGGDFLYATGDDFLRMSKYGHGYDGSNCSNINFRAPPRKLSAGADVGFHHDRSLSHHQFQARQLEMLRQQQMMKQHLQQKHHQMVQNQNRVRNSVIDPLGLSSSAWPSLQQAQQHPNCLGTRAMAMADHGKKRERAGTGVFLPRRNVAPAESRKKQDKVAQALKSKEKVPQLHHHPHHNGTSNSIGNDYGLRYGGNSIPEKRHGIWGQQVMKQQEIRLPQEWTY